MTQGLRANVSETLRAAPDFKTALWPLRAIATLADAYANDFCDQTFHCETDARMFASQRFKRASNAQPEIVAVAIVWAAHHHRREMQVGLPTVAGIEGNKLPADVMDRYLARNGYDSQQTDEPVEPNRRKSLPWHQTCALIRGGVTCPAVIRTNTPTSKSVRLNTSRKVTKSAAYPSEAERRAWATVNAVHHGGEKRGGGGYGKAEDHGPMRKGS